MRILAVKASTDRNQKAFLNWLELERHAALGCAGRENSKMTSLLHPMRKACPSCGRPMRLAAAENARSERFICPRCDGDPLHDPAARKWADGPLKAPEK